MDNNAVTKAEFHEEIKKLITKAEFHEEIKKLVTKEKFHEEIKKLVTKAEFQEKHDWLAKKVMVNTESIKALECKVDEGFKQLTQQMIELTEQVFNRFDDIVGRLDDLRTDKLALDYGLSSVEKKVEKEENRNNKQDEKLADHEGRISNLEVVNSA